MTYLPTIRANLLKSQKYTVYLYSKYHHTGSESCLQAPL